MSTPAKVVVVPKEPGRLDIVDIELPDPGPYQIVIKQYASGICHSQLHQMHAARENPVILGHESTGKVTKIGAEVKHVSPGDTVLVTWVPRNMTEGSRSPEPAILEPVSYTHLTLPTNREV